MSYLEFLRTSCWTIMWKQCTHNVTSRRFRVTVIVVEKQCMLRIVSVCVCVCVCNFIYPACIAHAPFCHLRPAPLSNIFAHYLINWNIFEKKRILNTKCVFWFSPGRLSDKKKNSWRIWRDIIINIHKYPWRVPVVLVSF